MDRNLMTMRGDFTVMDSADLAVAIDGGARRAPCSNPAPANHAEGGDFWSAWMTDDLGASLMAEPEVSAAFHRIVEKMARRA